MLICDDQQTQMIDAFFVIRVPQIDDTFDAYRDKIVGTRNLQNSHPTIARIGTRIPAIKSPVSIDKCGGTERLARREDVIKNARTLITAVKIKRDASRSAAKVAARRVGASQ